MKFNKELKIAKITELNRRREELCDKLKDIAKSKESNLVTDEAMLEFTIELSKLMFDQNDLLNVLALED